MIGIRYNQRTRNNGIFNLIEILHSERLTHFANHDGTYIFNQRSGNEQYLCVQKKISIEEDKIIANTRNLMFLIHINLVSNKTSKSVPQTAMWPNKSFHL